jgi:hypothetical protein
MDFIDAYDTAKSLRGILRRADNFGYDLQRLKEEILFKAEALEAYGEKQEMKMIIRMQRDLVEAN